MCRGLGARLRLPLLASLLWVHNYIVIYSDGTSEISHKIIHSIFFCIQHGRSTIPEVGVTPIEYASLSAESCNVLAQDFHQCAAEDLHISSIPTS